MRLTVDPLGRTLSTGAGSGSGGGALGDMMSGRFGAMPERALSVGDEWTDTETLDMSQAGGMGAGPLAISATYRVEGYKTVRGRDCVVISVVGEVGGDSLPRMPGVLDMSMEMDLEGVMFFDLEAGQMEKIAMDLSVDLSAEAPNGTLSLEMKLELDVDRE